MQKNGFDDALILNQRGNIRGQSSNLFMVQKGILSHQL
jgi:branched-subunit amino acid aminotransferase/4-amino-4-deoxychorismate lyase